ncbi:AraC family transcriptional regulator [Elstera cyanobacteriorum]|uniref:AraC family transcriptional regulator n=2 Tax=Elstera cyanobacteriorum TaxID=2022747 RepID=A0A255XTQ8_9PROT|nr:AraC family transcriptional regulator [Elstera cyanobacteriorum]
MPSIPLPFVISLVLCQLLVRMILQGPQRLGLFFSLVAAFAVQAALSGLNWNVGWYPARLIQPVLAAVLPALCFVVFKQLHRGEPATLARLWPHLLPALAVACLILLWREPIDAILCALDLGYGLALLQIARQGPGALAAARLGDERVAHKALVAMALLLILTGCVDAAIAIDFAFGDGQQASALLTAASILWLAAAGSATAIAGGSYPVTADETLDDPDPQKVPHSPAPPPLETLSEADAAILHRIDALMIDQHLYRDPDLTLERIARRAGIPGRQISAALNRAHGRNVSQIINAYRVAEAQQHLLSSRDSVTIIMLKVGFGTKSNFNREFLRVTGMTPSAYRRAGGPEKVLDPDSGRPIS